MIKRVFLLLAFNSFLNFRCNFLATIWSRYGIRLNIVDCLHNKTILSTDGLARSQLLGPGECGLGGLLGLPLGLDFGAGSRFACNLLANPAVLVATSDDLGCLAGGARFMKFCIGAGAARRLAGRL